MNAQRFSALIRLTRLDRPIGTFLLLWPTLWALWLAGDGHPDPTIVLIFIVGVFVMRSAGCVINDYADRHWDGKVERTQSRPMATGEIDEKTALVTFFVLLGLALALVLQLDIKTIKLSLFAVVIASVYPFTKRVTQLPQVVLGVAFSWGIPMAFMAHQGTVPLEGWLLFLANMLWVVAYDTIYAVVDRQDDLKAGIKSTAILFGHWARPIIVILQLSALALLSWLSESYQLSWHFQLGLGLALFTLIYQQWLMSSGEPQKTFTAFLNNNWTGAFVFIGILLGSL